jgi:hypothetical protein
MERSLFGAEGKDVVGVCEIKRGRLRGNSGLPMKKTYPRLIEVETSGDKDGMGSLST